MSFKAPKSYDYEKHPSGSFGARCYQVIDLGTHYNEKWMKSSHLVRITFETSKKMKDGRPFSIQLRVTLSMHEKAALRKYLESWRGRAFTRDEADTFDLEKLLGKCALLTITHSEDGEFANITGISSLPEGMSEPAAINDPVCYVIGQSGDEAWQKLSDKTREQINSSDEMTGKKTPDAAYPLNGEPPADGQDAAAPESPDDLPF